MMHDLYMMHVRGLSSSLYSMCYFENLILNSGSRHESNCLVSYLDIMISDSQCDDHFNFHEAMVLCCSLLL